MHADFAESPSVLDPVRVFKPIPQFSEALLAKFWSLVDRRGLDECWLWKGPVTNGKKGGCYGQWRGFRPHRIAYTLLVGPIDPQHTLDHLRESGLCTSTLCCNPAHLEPVTQSENTKRYRRTLPRVCKRGHQMAPKGNCQQCIDLKLSEWLEKNRDGVNAYRREWYAANRDKISEQRKQRKLRKKELVLA